MHKISIKRNGGSSVARWGGGYSPSIGMSTKMQNKENTTSLAFLELFFFALEWTKKRFKASFETYIPEGGLICQKLKSQINKNFEKCPKINNQI